MKTVVGNDRQDNGYVLLLGVQHENNTSLYLVEYRYQISHGIEQTFATAAAVRDPKTNKRRWLEWKDYDYNVDDFNDIGRAFEAAEGNAKVGTVGLAACRLMKQYLLIDFATDCMIKNRFKHETS